MTYEELKQVNERLNELCLHEVLTNFESDCFSFLEMFADLNSQNDTWDETIEMYENKLNPKWLAIICRSLVKWLRFIKENTHIEDEMWRKLESELRYTIKQWFEKLESDELIQSLKND